MVLAGQLQEAVRHVLRLAVPGRDQIPPQPQRLAHRHPVVAVAVGDEHRGGDRLDLVVRGEGAVPVRRHVLVLVHPHLRRGRIGGAVLLRQRPQPGVGDDRVEAVAAPGDPVRHEPAEGGAQQRGARAVELGPLQDLVEERLALVEDHVRPARPATVQARVPVAGGHRRIGHEHRIAALDREPRAPAPAPGVVRAVRAAMDPQHHRCRLGGRGGGGGAEPAADGDPVEVGLDPLERSRQRAHRARRGQLGDGGGAFRVRGVDPHRAGRGRDIAAQREQGAVLAGGEGGEDAAVRDGAGLAGGGVHGEHRPGGVQVAGDQQRGGVRPLEIGEGEVAELGHHRRGALGALRAVRAVRSVGVDGVVGRAGRAGPTEHLVESPDLEAGVAGVVRGGQGRAQHREAGAVGGEGGAAVLHLVVGAQQRAARAGRGVDQDHVAAGLAAAHPPGPGGRDRGAVGGEIGRGGVQRHGAGGGGEVGELTGRGDQHQVALGVAELAVPQPDRHPGVPDGGLLRVLAGGAALGVVLEGAAGQHLRGGEHRAVLDDGEQGEPARCGRQQACLTRRGQAPQRGLVLVGPALRVRAGGGEQH